MAVSDCVAADMLEYALAIFQMIGENCAYQSFNIYCAHLGVVLQKISGGAASLQVEEVEVGSFAK
jgi:hypothetical protein